MAECNLLKMYWPEEIFEYSADKQRFLNMIFLYSGVWKRHQSTRRSDST